MFVARRHDKKKLNFMEVQQTGISLIELFSELNLFIQPTCLGENMLDGWGDL